MNQQVLATVQLLPCVTISVDARSEIASLKGAEKNRLFGLESIFM